MILLSGKEEQRSSPDMSHQSLTHVWPPKATGKGHKWRSPAGVNQKTHHLGSTFHFSWWIRWNSQQTGLKWADTHPQIWKAYSAAGIWTGCFFHLLWSHRSAHQTHRLDQTLLQLTDTEPPGVEQPGSFPQMAAEKLLICPAPPRASSVTPRCSCTTFVPPPAMLRARMENRA